MRYLPLLWAGLFRKKTRTILTLLSVVVAFLLFGLLQAVTVAFESGADSADAKRLLTTARYSIIEPLPMSYLRRIEQVPGVVGVAYADWFGAKYQNESNAFPVFAVDPGALPRHVPGVHHRARAARGLRARRAPAPWRASGWPTASAGRSGQKLPISSEIHPKADGSMNWEFDLVGILDADDPAVRGNTDMVLINVAYFDEARQIGRGKTGWYIVRVADSDARPGPSPPTIDTLFANSPDETKTQPEKEFAIGFAKQIGDIGALVTRILIAVFFTILILTGNTMAQSIRERIPELAILKTLGFSDGKVTALVLAEAVLLLLLGGGVGMGAAVGLPCPRSTAPPAAASRRCSSSAEHLAARAVAPSPLARSALAHRPAARRCAPKRAARSSTRWSGHSTACAALNQIAADHARSTCATIPQRLGTSLVVVIGIAGVVGVLVSVLAMSEGFRHTLASTGRPTA